MGEDKNVFLTIMHNDQTDDNDEIKVDFSVIGKHIKRFFALWLCLALGLGCLSGASGLLLQKVLVDSAAKAMISFPGTAYDITKIKSPAVVGEVLDTMGLDAADMQDYQNAVEISGVIPASSYEELSMYYDLLDKNTSNTLEIIRSLLGTSYNVSQYIISFNYAEAKLSQKDGVAFLNALLDAYRDYCVKVYTHDATLSNPLSAISYSEYDYAEAVNIFATILDNATSYLSGLRSGAGTFRSTETGLTFQDLHRTASLLKGIDLDRLSSYIVIHSVSDRDPQTEISYYQWRIEQLEQQKAVQQTRFDSLTDSINSYKKDDIIIISGNNGSSTISSPESVNASYDTMIQEKLDAQASIASYTRTIAYFQSVIEGFENTEDASRPEDIQYVREGLEQLNKSVKELLQNIALTVDEYYENVAFSDLVRVIVPSTAEELPLISPTTVKLVLAVEALLFLCYCGAAFVQGLREANPRTEDTTEKPEPATV
ncbi:MAG: hypothetical protein IJR72_01210 [Oscillospiraceae bacterium]|nr:hypothetical protein [Oscillospiraceae bacterium]